MKILVSFFVLYFYVTTTFSQDIPNADYFNKHEDSVIDLPPSVPNFDFTEATLLYDNGPFVTAPGGGPSGSDGSVLQNSTLQHNVLGFAFLGPTYRVADDFSVPEGFTWTIDSIIIYGYQTGSTTTSTFTTCNYRILLGNEPATATLFYGDETTNKMTATYWTGAYRYSQTTTGTTRPIMAVQVSGGVTLDPGIYLLDYQTTGSLASGPWAVPITIVGQAVTGNAFQRISATAYQPLNDSLLNGPTPSRQGLPFKIYGTQSVVPVELTSFTAAVVNDQVELNWTTATELNNKGFEVQRSASDNQFVTVAFVNGHGTSTQSHAYSFLDKNIAAGKYSYRLKQVDFDGKFEYSNAVEVEIIAPSIFSLEQNYPNPFNPSTKINFSVAVDSKIDIRLFNALGQEVNSVFSGSISAGNHELIFDGSKLNSGMYVYKMDAQGIDGTNFSSVKKMMLVK